MVWEEFLAAKFGIWVDTLSGTFNALHGSGKPVDKKWHFTSN